MQKTANEIKKSGFLIPVSYNFLIYKIICESHGFLKFQTKRRYGAE